MVFWLTILLAVLPAMPEARDLPAHPEMPDPLVFADGQRVTTAAQWSQRRIEMKQILEHYFIGHMPPAPGNMTCEDISTEAVLSGLATARRARLSFGPDHKLSFEIVIFAPAKGKPPFRTIVHPSFSKAPYAHPEIFADALKRDYAIVTFYYQQCGVDRPNFRETGFFPACPEYDWADLAAWAWGMSRCVDYIETQPQFDRNRLIALGHSRLGKATLIAGAFDDRFALVAPAGSGCAGTGAFRFNGKARGGKEGLEDVIAHFPQWVSPHLAQFTNQVEKLPFDQHWLIALVAPRAFIAADADGDQYCNANALTQSVRAAEPVFDLLGATSRLLMHFRPGKHELSPDDWKAILDFADQQLR